MGACCNPVWDLIQNPFLKFNRRSKEEALVETYYSVGWFGVPGSGKHGSINHFVDPKSKRPICGAKFTSDARFIATGMVTKTFNLAVRASGGFRLVECRSCERIHEQRRLSSDHRTT